MFCLQTACSYNILVTVVGVSGSQNLLMYRLAEHLAQVGHSVTILKAEVFPEAKTPKLTKAKELAYTAVSSDVIDQLRERMWGMPWEEHAGLPPLGLVYQLFTQIFGSCEAMINRTEVHPTMKKLEAQTYDVAIIHLMDMCGFGIAEMLGIKVIYHF